MTPNAGEQYVDELLSVYQHWSEGTGSDTVHTCQMMQSYHFLLSDATPLWMVH